MNARRPAAAAPARERNVRITGSRFAGWREHHGWSAASSLRRLAARPLGSLLTITVMGLALALPLAFYLLLANVERVGDALGQGETIDVFLQPGQGQAQANLLARELEKRPELVAVTLKSPTAGLDELARLEGFSSALALAGDNPLPWVLELAPRPGSAAPGLERLAADVRALPGVDQVRDGGSWRRRLDALLGVGRRVVAVLAGLLAFAALLVIGNSVRTEIASRHEEIDVLLLVGANRAFVRRPYLYAGLWLGLLSGVLAVLLAVGMELALAAPVAALSQAYDGRLHVAGLPFPLLATVPFAAAALGWLGARLVSVWQLRGRDGP